MHPLITDATTLRDNELESKILDLSKKYTMCGNNVGVRDQILMMLDTYRHELDNRRAAEWERVVKSKKKEFDKLINVS